MNLSPAAVLLDLDNTLLGNPMEKFLPAYFALLETHLQPYLQGQALAQLMVSSVQVMQANQDPAVTNLVAFMTDFAQRLGVPGEALQPLIETFYRDDYPQLQQHTLLRAEARELVSHLLQAGHPVVIATNPLFPDTAIMQRLAWAGIADFPYTLVTTMENMCFSKPNPLYYQEILARIGAPPETTWMVGDDLENDIIPARTLGLKTWWITEAPETGQADKEGALADFLAWVKAERLS